MAIRHVGENQAEWEVRRFERDYERGIRRAEKPELLKITVTHGSVGTLDDTLEAIGCRWDGNIPGYVTTKAAVATWAQAILSGDPTAWTGEHSPRARGAILSHYLASDKARARAVREWLADKGDNPEVFLASPTLANEICDVFCPELPQLS